MNQEYPPINELSQRTQELQNPFLCYLKLWNLFYQSIDIFLPNLLIKPVIINMKPGIIEGKVLVSTAGFRFPEETQIARYKDPVLLYHRDWVAGHCTLRSQSCFCVNENLQLLGIVDFDSINLLSISVRIRGSLFDFSSLPPILVSPKLSLLQLAGSNQSPQCYSWKNCLMYYSTIQHFIS